MRRSPLVPLLLFGAVMAGLAVVFLFSRADAAEGWEPPLDDAGDRPMLLTFGLYVTPDPARNPIDPPERFTGYHTALDLEILPGEEDAEVPVRAACDGQILQATTAEGYGGVIVQRCMLEGRPVSVIYGHVEPASFRAASGDDAARGDVIAALAAHKSPGSGDTRKHLHFGIHRGTDPVLLGYAQTEAELADFVDPKAVLGL